MDSFDDFVQTSRSAALPVSDPSGYEQDEHVAVTALETGFISSDVYGQDGSALPIFQLGRVQYAFPAPLACLTVSSNILTMCLYAYPSLSRMASTPTPAPPKLVRINLDEPEKTLEAEVPLPPTPRMRNGPPSDPSLLGPHKMFSDPSGKHLILTTRNGDNFYWISGWKRARALPRLKGLLIESIAWNHGGELSQRTAIANRKGQSQIVTTGEILLGVQGGDIYETMLVTQPAHDAEDGDFLDRLARRAAPSGPEVDRYLRHLFRLPERQPITGLTAEVFKNGPPGRAVVIATTSTRIYEFVGELSRGHNEYDNEGEDLYEKLFLPYRSDAIPNLKSELPGDLPYSELHLWTPKGKRNAKALAWLTGPGIYHGMLAFHDQQVGDSIIDSANLLPYPAVALDSQDERGREETVAEIPLSIALSEFHFVLLYRDRIMAISSLDDRVVYEEVLPLQPQERVIATTVDIRRKTYWIYTDASIFELVLRQEDRDVWQVYLNRNNHEQALRYAKTTAQRELILSSQGDQFFRDGRQIQAAQCYAQTFNRTFEEIVLKFIDSTERDALRYYLVMRLERLKKGNLMQRMMLATWLVEIYLAKINDLEDVAAAEEASQNVDNYRIEMDLLQDELRQFLATYRDNLDRKTVFGLINRHGRTDFMLHYALIVGEHDRIVRHWIQEEQWEQAIAALDEQPSLDIYYKFAPVLIRNAPAQAVRSWMKRESLDPKRLIPAMLVYKAHAEESHHIIRYLQHVTHHGVTEAAIHNLLLSLLAEQGGEGTGALLEFINRGHPNTEPCYDLDYALRMCSSHGRIEACVRIYAKMNNFESAVDLAIEAGNIDLACSCADAVQGSTTQRKKLWLKIAQYIVQDKQDISVAMDFLSRTELLSIEDILPIFPDFTIIDSFKEEICHALETYSNRIESLKVEMDQATQSAEAIRADTQRLANRFVTIEGRQKCGVCLELLLQRQFYIFACGHAFHADCLIAETTRHLPQRTLRRILLLQEQLSKLTNGRTNPLPSTETTLTPDKAGRRRGKGGEINASALNMMGLDKLRDMVLPDVIVGAISAGVSVSVAGGRKVLAPLDPFADPTASLRALPKDVVGAAAHLKDGEGGEDEQLADSQGGRRREEEERIEGVRRELDSLVAHACILCDGSIQAINRQFIEDAQSLQDWEL